MANETFKVNSKILDVIKQKSLFIVHPYLKESYKKFIFPIIEKYRMIPEFFVNQETNDFPSNAVNMSAMIIFDDISLITPDFNKEFITDKNCLIITPVKKPNRSKQKITIKESTYYTLVRRDFDNNFLQDFEKHINNLCKKMVKHFYAGPVEEFENEHYNSAILYSITIMESFLGNVLRKNTKTRFQILIDKAKERNLINDNEKDLLDRWRVMRNTIVHNLNYDVNSMESKKVVDGVIEIINKILQNHSEPLSFT